MTVRIPRHLLAHVNPRVFEWLVPGLLPEKLLLLLRRLPKQVRRRLVPPAGRGGPDYGRHGPRPGLALPGTGTGDLRAFQVSVRRGGGRTASPAHLRMRFLLVDEQGRTARPRPLLQRPAAGPGRTGAGDRQRTGTAALPPGQVGVEDLDLEPRLVVAGADSRRRAVVRGLRVDEIHNRVLVLHGRLRSPAARQNRLGLRFSTAGSAARRWARCASSAVRPATATRPRLSTGAVCHGTAQPAAGLSPRPVLPPARASWSPRPVSRALHGRGPWRGRGTHRHRSARPGAGRARAATRGTRSHHRTGDPGQAEPQLRRNPRGRLPGRARPDPSGRFSRDPPGCRPGHTLRYLRRSACASNMGEHSPAKDAKKGERLQEPGRLRQMARFDSPSACAQSRRELPPWSRFRVSIFAPELGTAQPVSEQRLARRLARSACCRSVE